MVMVLIGDVGWHGAEETPRRELEPDLVEALKASGEKEVCVTPGQMTRAGMVKRAEMRSGFISCFMISSLRVMLVLGFLFF